MSLGYVGVTGISHSYVLKITMVLFIIMVGFKLCIYTWHWSIFGILCFPLGLLQTLSFAHARTDKYKLCFSTVNLRTAYVVFLCTFSYPASFIYSQNMTNTKRFCMASLFVTVIFHVILQNGLPALHRNLPERQAYTEYCTRNRSNEVNNYTGVFKACQTSKTEYFTKIVNN